MVCRTLAMWLYTRARAEKSCARKEHVKTACRDSKSTRPLTSRSMLAKNAAYSQLPLILHPMLAYGAFSPIHIHMYSGAPALDQLRRPTAGTSWPPSLSLEVFSAEVFIVLTSLSSPWIAAHALSMDKEELLLRVSSHPHRSTASGKFLSLGLHLVSVALSGAFELLVMSTIVTPSGRSSMSNKRPVLARTDVCIEGGKSGGN